MRRVCYSVAMSLDGYIADPKGGYDWIVIDPEIDFDAMFKRYDTVLMGRKSYDAAKQQGGYGMPGPKAYVFSKTLKQADAPDVAQDSYASEAQADGAEAVQEDGDVDAELRGEVLEAWDTEQRDGLREQER